MRKYLLSIVVAGFALVTSHHANAQVTQDIQLNAVVPSYCTIGGAFTTSPVGPYTIPVDTAGVVDDSTIVIPAIADVACNKAAEIETESLSGGVTTGVAATGAAHTIHYVAVATFGGASSTINTAMSSTGSLGTTGGAATGNLSVTVTPDQPALPLTPGTYSDTLRVTLTPTP